MAVKFNVNTAPEPETPFDPGALAIVTVASPTSLRMSFTDVICTPSRVNISPGDASFNFSIAGSYLILIGDAENRSAALSICTTTFTGSPCFTSTAAGANFTCALLPAEGAAAGGAAGAVV